MPFEFLDRCLVQLVGRSAAKESRRLVLGERRPHLLDAQRTVILQANRLTSHAADELILPGEVKPRRIRYVSRLLLPVGDAPFGVDQEPIGIDRARRAGSDARATRRAGIEHLRPLPPVRITRDVEQRYPVEERLFIEPAEVELYQALSQAEETPRSPGSVDDFLIAFLPMIPAINRFFDKVLVMSEDVELRENRLGLLQRIVALSSGVADMSKLEGF